MIVGMDGRLAAARTRERFVGDGPAITSLAFMFDWVPLPVCQIASGNWSS
jgi:hypothetical protein